MRKKDIGLYRDDGLAVFENKSGPESEKIKKLIQAVFRENQLKITIQKNCGLFRYNIQPYRFFFSSVQ